MKRRLLTLCISCLTVLSVSSCMGKETRIDNAEGREIARVALENT